jgi:ketosteroid isomerase-like protein
VGNARVRLAAPRYAGIISGSGRVTITAANATVEGRLAWVLVDYRWSNPAERRVEAGRATVICERRGNSWKIVHVHSSQPLPWEPS